LNVLGQVATGKKPDCILYEPRSKRVLAFNGEAGTVTVIDAAASKAVATIELGGKPEFAVADPSGKVFVNLEDKDAIAAIDPAKGTKLSEWAIAQCDEPTGLSLDAEHHRLFAGCHNERLVVVNAENGKSIASLPIGKGVDATAFDPATRLVFTSNGEGTLTVIHQDSPDAYSVLENVPTQKSARTMALDPVTHRIYSVAAKFEERTTASAGEHAKRPAMIPGSAVLLVLTK
jgi:YVTN family beta-propeller protein